MQKQIPPSYDIALSTHVVATPELSASQKKINHLIREIEALSSQLNDVQHIGDRCRMEIGNALGPLHSQFEKLKRELVLLLHHHLLHGDANKKIQNIAREIICVFSISLIRSGDSEILNIFNLYREKPDTSDSIQQNSESELESEFEQDWESESASRQDTDKSHQDDAEYDHEFKNSGGSRTRDRKVAQEKIQANASQDILRTLYRQLVSHLHPDRELDPKEQIRKTALLSQVTKSYTAKDIHRLLLIHSEISQTNQISKFELPKNKLKIIQKSLQTQLGNLKEQLIESELFIRAELGLDWNIPLDSKGIERFIKKETRELKQQIKLLGNDLRTFSDPDELECWLIEQAMLMRAY